MDKEKLGLPWDIDEICIFDDNGDVVMDRGGASFSEYERFILKAANNHHSLVDALESLLSWPRKIRTEDIDLYRKEMDIITKTLEEAKGE